MEHLNREYDPLFIDNKGNSKVCKKLVIHSDFLIKKRLNVLIKSKNQLNRMALEINQLANSSKSNSILVFAFFIDLEVALKATNIKLAISRLATLDLKKLAELFFSEYLRSDGKRYPALLNFFVSVSTQH